MPIRWNPQQDHLLLLKILETHPNINLDVEKVAKAWPPGPKGVGPTPRAIRERLTKIRELAKQNGSTSHFSIAPSGVLRTASATNGVNPSAPGASIYATPKKNSKGGNGLPTPIRTASRITATSTSRKRGSGCMSDSELTDESELEEDLTNFFETPSKTGDKRRLRAAPPKKYAVDGDEELGGIGSDDSDFDPNAEREKEQNARQRRGIAGGSSGEYHQ